MTTLWPSNLWLAVRKAAGLPDDTVMPQDFPGEMSLGKKEREILFSHYRDGEPMRRVAMKCGYADKKTSKILAETINKIARKYKRQTKNLES